MGDNVSNPTDTGAIHGGALWQPQIQGVSDYDLIVAADVNDAWYPPAPRVLETLAEWSPRVHHSPDSTGRRLCEVISRHYAIPPESIRLGAGSSDLLHHIISSCLNPGDELLTLSPTYAEYARAAHLAAAQVRTIPLDPADRFQASADRVLEAVRPATRLIALCNPNNPTGAVLSRSEVLRVLDNLPEQTFVLIDEAYIDFAPDESLLGDAPEFENLAVVRTFSKAYAMAGLRVGYAALGARVRGRFDLRGRPPWPVGLLGLRAAEVALEERCYVQCRISEFGVLKSALQAAITEEVPAHALPKAAVLPSLTHYFLVDLEGTGVAVPELLGRLRDQGIFLRDLCGFCDLYHDRFIRITTQSAPDNPRIAQAFEDIMRR